MNILINPETGKEYVNVPVKVAAEYLGIAPGLVRYGLIEKSLPIGTAVSPQTEGGKFKFVIPPERLKAYKNGDDIKFDIAAEKILRYIELNKTA